MSILRKRLKELLILTFVLLLSVPTLIYCDDNNKVDRYSKSSILIDQTTNRVMFEKDPDAKRPLASLSKMMTFLIALEAIENKEVSKNDIITIDKDMANVKGSSYHLKVGEKVPLYELMKGLMIVSGNDAAVAISKHIGKSEESFVKIMNKKAKEIGMKNTNFVNCNGLPIYSLSDPKKPPKENISTARDIAILGKYMMDNYEKEVTAITDMQTYNYSERRFCKNNTNGLLSIIPEVDGIKTGYTDAAGKCLLSTGIKNNIRVISAVFKSTVNDLYLDSRTLLDYGFDNFYVETIVDKNEFIKDKKVFLSKEKNFYKAILSIVIPITFQNLISVSVNMADTIMLGTLGEIELSASSIGGQLFFILMVLLMGIGSGANVMCAQNFGKEDKININKILSLAYLIANLLSLS